MTFRPDFSFEDRCLGRRSQQAPSVVCGIDEAGRGPLAGPVVAAAVIIGRARMPAAIAAQINDSKKLTPKKRAYLFDKIHEFSDVSIAECSVAEIDAINILQASLRAMQKAFDGLGVRPGVALVDGNKAPKLNCEVKTIVGGDGKSLSIAAASIVAKHYRDRLMARIADEFPHYGWERNAGYGTAYHLKALEIYGVSIHHRRSFSPVFQKLLKESSANN